MGILNTFLELVVYVLVGMVMMVAGYTVIDWVVPSDFPEEIKKGNKAVGWVSAGIYIGLGLIIKYAIETLAIKEVEMKLLNGVIDTVYFSISGIVCFLVAYFLIDLVNRKYNFNQELKAGNEAIGIMIFGIFVGIALIISGVIR